MCVCGAILGGVRQVLARRLEVWLGNDKQVDRDGWLALRAWKGEMWSKKT